MRLSLATSCGGQWAGLLPESLSRSDFLHCLDNPAGADYRRLKRRGCPACARFGSDFHQLLRVLGERLNGQPRPTLQLVLGQPDRVRGDSLVYYWRGEHDYLYFRLGADQRGHSAWYYAYE